MDGTCIRPEEVKAMPTGRREALAAFAVAGALAAGGAALADAATKTPAATRTATPTATPTAAPQQTAPRHRGDCPNMPGDSAGQSGATAL